VQIPVPGTQVVIYDVGPGLNAVFFDFYQTGNLDLARLRAAAFAYFTVTPNPDWFAFNFTVSSLPRNDTQLAFLLFWDLSRIHRILFV
jgi:hypothetical protein